MNRDDLRHEYLHRLQQARLARHQLVRELLRKPLVASPLILARVHAALHAARNEAGWYRAHFGEGMPRHARTALRFECQLWCAMVKEFQRRRPKHVGINMRECLAILDDVVLLEVELLGNPLSRCYATMLIALQRRARERAT